jgi:hypothetical protein
MANDRKFEKTPTFRGSYVALIKPKVQKGDDGQDKKPQYSMLACFPKNDPTTKAFLPKLKALINEAYKAKFGKPINEAHPKYPIKNGDAIGDDGAHKGQWCLNLASNFKPDAVDKDGNKLETEDEAYSGAWYRAKISAWAWDHKVGGKGVSLNLETVIKIKDDEEFGGGGNAADDFADELGEGGTDPADEEVADDDMLG